MAMRNKCLFLAQCFKSNIPLQCEARDSRGERTWLPIPYSILNILKNYYDNKIPAFLSENHLIYPTLCEPWNVTQSIKTCESNTSIQFQGLIRIPSKRHFRGILIMIQRHLGGLGVLKPLLWARYLDNILRHYPVYNSDISPQIYIVTLQMTSHLRKV